MTTSMELYFKIGPFLIALEAPSFPRDWPHPFYGPFQGEGSGAPALRVRIRTDPPPPLREEGLLTAQFENQWRFYAFKEGYRFEALEQMRFNPRGVAFLNQEMDQAEYYFVYHGYIPDEEEGSSDWSLGSLMEPFVQWWLTLRLALSKKGMILHGGAVSLSGSGNDASPHHRSPRKGLAFFGPSGAGKTTLSRLFQERQGAQVLCDERIILWREEGGWQVSGTPWYGELHTTSSLSSPLAGLWILKKAQVNRLAFLPPRKFLSTLLQEVFLPLWNRKAMDRLVGLALQLCEEIPSGEIEFRNDASAVDYLWGQMDFSFPPKRDRERSGLEPVF